MSEGKKRDQQHDIDRLKTDKALHQRLVQEADRKLKQKQLQQQRIRREGLEMD